MGCHIHSGMSAKIEIVGAASDAQVINPVFIGSARGAAGAYNEFGQPTQAAAIAVYTTIVAENQPALNVFDEACGTSSAFTPADYASCQNSHFLCDASPLTFDTCLQAIDCKMHRDMAVEISGTSKFATFARQMIPHHQNAVSMAKTLSKEQSTAVA